MVPTEPIKVGEPFSVQYVIDDEKADGFVAPSFQGFRVISGPNTYYGNEDQGHGKISKNIVFTLVADKAGRFMIPGAVVRHNGQLVKSNSTWIWILDKESPGARKLGVELSTSEYFLRPGENAYEKINKSLFIKVGVDKKTCFVGQPVVATFKLYSQLESKSDIIKNPGFYGFTVFDMLNLNDHLSSTEIINGKVFDVHTIRVVQLFPLQAGIFDIDPMEVVNKVEFSRSAVTRKPEQEIREGVFNDDSLISNPSNTVVYETHISTERIHIEVKPHPLPNKPTQFAGATGRFTIEATVEKDTLAKNEQGAFLVTLRGKGNFTQLAAPHVDWPEGIESFDPTVRDSFEKAKAPISGSRTFRYPFICSRPGEIQIPAISIAYFDPDSNKYRTITTEVSRVTVHEEEMKSVPPENPSTRPEAKKFPAWIIAILTLVAAAIVILITWTRKKKKSGPEPRSTPANEELKPVSIEQLLQPARFAWVAEDRKFYSILQKVIWDFLAARLDLAGSHVNKKELLLALSKSKMDQQQIRVVIEVLEQCETAIFTGTEPLETKENLLTKAERALQQLNT
jgi:hypothetical protein